MAASVRSEPFAALVGRSGGYDLAGSGLAVRLTDLFADPPLPPPGARRAPR